MSNSPIVTFIIICYGERNEFHVSLGSLLCQKNPRWAALVMHDGPSEETRKIVEGFNDPRITYYEAEKNEGSWGAYNRIRGLGMVDTEYVIQTTAQEYYLPITVDEIEKNKNYDLIYWPFTHYNGDYNVINPAPVRRRMDWSNFALKTHIARKVGINHPTDYMCDGLFIEEVMQSGLVRKQIVIQKLLSTKN